MQGWAPYTHDTPLVSVRVTLCGDHYDENITSPNVMAGSCIRNLTMIMMMKAITLNSIVSCWAQSLVYSVVAF